MVSIERPRDNKEAAVGIVVGARVRNVDSVGKEEGDPTLRNGRVEGRPKRLARPPLASPQGLLCWLAVSLNESDDWEGGAEAAKVSAARLFI